MKQYGRRQQLKQHTVQYADIWTCQPAGIPQSYVTDCVQPRDNDNALVKSVFWGLVSSVPEDCAVTQGRELQSIHSH